jgi:hypothetical protein
MEDQMRTTQLPRTMGFQFAPTEDVKVTGSTAVEAISDRSDPSHDVLQSRHDFWIQTLKNHPLDISEGVYLPTFQKGRGQHITSLSARQARELGERLVALADEIETEAMRAS